MDRLTILRLAMEKAKDPAEAMALAREMAAFVEGGAPPEPKAASVAKPVSVNEAPRPKPATTEIPKSKSAAPRRRTHWGREEKERAAALLDAGASYEDVARMIGRSKAAVIHQRVAEHLPVQKHKLNEINILRGQVAALSRGESLRNKRGENQSNEEEQ